MKSRMTIATALVVALVLSITGTSFALDGPSGDAGAAEVQYGSTTVTTETLTPPTTTTTTPTTTTTTQVLSHTTQIGNEETTPTTTKTTPVSHTLAQVEEETPAKTTTTEKKSAPVVASAAEQVAAVEQPQESGDSLPYTGYPALIVLIGGLAILSLGVFLRRQTRKDTGA